MGIKNRVPEQICVVRHAEPLDGAFVSQILIDVFGEHVEGTFGRPFTDILAAEDEHAFIAFVDDQPIGCILASVTGRAILHSLGVVQAFRNHHHGTTLIEWAIAWLGARNPSVPFTAAVDAGNPADCDRFERLGFGRIRSPELSHASFSGLVILSRDDVISRALWSSFDEPPPRLQRSRPA